MNVTVNPATPDQPGVLGNLLELYLHDFTDYDDNDVAADGRYGFDRLPDYFREPERHPYLVTVEGKYAGFALVRQASHFDGDAGVTDMTEFFVMRKYRRKQVGSVVARTVFDIFPGRWEVRVMATNTPAQPFWRRTIDQYTGGAFDERWSDEEKWRGPVFSFVASGRG